MPGRLHRGGRARLALVAAGLGVVLTGCSSATPNPPEPTGTGQALDCGLSTFDDGHQVMRYCGEGTAAVDAAGTRAEVTGAVCEQRGEFLTANFGTNYSNETAARGEYVGILLTGLPKDDATATVKVAAIEVIIDGERQAITGTVAASRVKDGRLEGSLTGNTGQGPARIEFDCAIG